MINIDTIIYFVRHAESPYIPGMERSRGLSEKGSSDAVKVKDLLKNEDMDVFISSPYERARLTIKVLAHEKKKDIIIEENLRERQWEFKMTTEQFFEAKRRVYEDMDHSLPGGESSRLAQERAVTALKTIMNEYNGKSIVVGTHGDIMTLMMNYFDPAYGFEFWKSTTMPDIYRLQIEENTLKRVTRLWK